MITTPILALEGVSRRYAQGVTALQEVTLQIAPGVSVALRGPSGCGKSTLLHMLCGLDRPSAGRALFNGTQPASAGAWARIRAARIGFVFQAFHLLPMLNAMENVQIPMLGIERNARSRRRRAETLLERVGLAARACHRPGQLSGGECQRVAIARSLANKPDVILADEPTGNLDSQTSAAILGLLADIHKSDGVTLVMATHDATISSFAQRTIHMLDGRLLVLPSAEAVISCTC
ncbi:MAG: ABC transporter ATP-binding protein [Candidatus Aminicenantes bacterium]|nr:ABC transporter ATP-binding protein [Candidatus Aminicenantes bacterium]